MKTSRGVFLVIVLIAITVLFIGCKTTKIIIPEPFPPPLAEYFQPEHFSDFKVDLSDLNSSLLKRVIEKHTDEVIFSNFVFDVDHFSDKFSDKKDNTMWAVIYRIQTVMTSEEVIAFIKTMNGELPGDLGLILAWEQGKDSFPTDSTNLTKQYIVGFSEKSTKLWEGYGKSHKVMCVSKYSNQDDWLFDTGCYKHNWYSNYYVLFFVSEEDMPKLFSH
ncbi:MAG: hypothetical protein WC603_03145 [Candidatus Paceibacterota bacterium]|jgi:hypothetical protein